MAPLRKQIAPDIVADAKRLYEQTLTPTRDIAAMMGIAASTFNNRINDWGWSKRAATRAIDIARVVRGSAVAALTVPPHTEQFASARTDPALPERRFALAARIQSVVEREMDAVEKVLGRIGPSDQVEAERSARTLASLSRAMREIAALTKPEEVTPSDDTDDDRRQEPGEGGHDFGEEVTAV